MHPTPRIARWLVVAAALLLFAWPQYSRAAEQRPATLSVTPAERAWLAAHPTIRVGFDPGWPPFSIADAQRGCVGIDADLLEVWTRELGVKFEFVVQPSWPAAYAAAQRGAVDLLVGTARTAERARDFLFTDSYFSFPVVIVTRHDEPILWSVLDLKGRKVAGVKDYATTTEMKRNYPSLGFFDVNSVAEALKAVSEGDADAFVTNLPNASFVAKTHGLTNLKIAGVMPERFDIRYAVRRDWPELQGILNRAIEGLTEADRQALVHPWIRVDYERVIRWDLVWKAALAVLAVLGAVLSAVIYHNRRLARELAERIRLQREITEAHDQLLRLNEEKSELLQVAAHDLRGPLTGMQLVVDSSLRLNALPGADALGIVEKQVRQMTALLDNVLDVEALESGRRQFSFETVDPAELVRGSVGRLSAVAANKDIRIECRCDEGLPTVTGDRTALGQIVDNLVSNGLKFSPRSSTVTVTLRRWNEFVRMEVRDQGPGVKAEEREKIFAKYSRGSARPTGGEKSTGLGLSIVRQLASAMNGRVWCESDPGPGATFVFLVPAEKA